jgi:hypothetical protein
MVALTAAASSGAGDLSATPLSASANWSAGGNSGSFNWSYGVRTPPSLGGPQPEISLGYSSQSVDGLTAATNNQPSWIGSGYEYSPGHIERRYVSCSDDMGGAANNSSASGDDCWKTDNATMTLNGETSELLYNATDGRWHARSENGDRILRMTGAPNGDNNGEYWVVTTPDGTSYYFGLNELDGWTTGKPKTNSVFTQPVYGNNPGEQCHQSTFAASSCAQAWRWNLDYVVDSHGNTMSYWYSQETNSYGRTTPRATWQAMSGVGISPRSTTARTTGRSSTVRPQTPCTRRPGRPCRSPSPPVTVA